MAGESVTIDGNEAAAYVAHKTNEVIAIYPITPSSPMAEHCDEWSSWGRANVWGTVPHVVEMQSEGGAAGATHGSLQAGSLTTSFTSSQGLLLWMPNMFKIAGELLPCVLHIAARTVATHALSIFGDHSDVMAARTTGWAMLFGASVQEAQDFALISQAATLQGRVPFMNVQDGFRTSHEVAKIAKVSDGEIVAMIDEERVREHRERALSPDRPVTRGTAQNPDVFFQSREAANPYYLAVPGLVQQTMDRFAVTTGRAYHLFDYVGAPDAERVLVLMGSSCETAQETVEYLAQQGERVGAVKVRLFRPFAREDFLRALPETTRAIAVLDRTKEPGAVGEPLYEEVVTALGEGAPRGEPRRQTAIRVIGGRYGLSSKEFTPAMAKAVLDELGKDEPKNHFTVGIDDDVTHTSLAYDRGFSTEPADVIRGIFWGFGSDGTVGANKDSIKIIGEATDYHAQGYFVYDSRKAGAVTISHLRFGPRPIRSIYLIDRANFIGVHQFGFLERFRVLDAAADGATLLLNSPHAPERTWDEMPRVVQEQIIARHLTVYAINAYDIAQEVGLGNRINTIMQTCFFAISNVLPAGEAVDLIKATIRDTYGKRGETVVRQNYAAVDSAVAGLYRVEVPERATGRPEVASPVPPDSPPFVREVVGAIVSGDGDSLPVSAMPVDGTFMAGTTRYQKRNMALEVPVWVPEICIQCGRCSLYCPHAVVRAKIVDAEHLRAAPPTFKSTEARWREAELVGKRFTIQVSAEDCTGCAVCVEVCPAKDKSAVGRKALNMEPQPPIREQGSANFAFFLGLPGETPPALRYSTTKNVQLLQPTFEFHSACAGCGETPYVRLLSQLLSDRLLIANATGCSSIYSANLPDTAWAAREDGRGAAWINSLFEDNAEMGFGLRLSVDAQSRQACELVQKLRDAIGAELADGLLSATQADAEGVEAQRRRVASLKEALARGDDADRQRLLGLAGSLVRRSVWCIGGDGWAYDIGYGGLDHVLAMGRNVKVLVLDSQVYSNTGGQASKATALGAVAKFAAGGKRTPRKDLGLMAMSYGNAYVAQVAMGANDGQTIRALLEAESYDGPALVIAYSTCIAQGINMTQGMDHEKAAVDSGYWILYRYDPRLRLEGRNPLQLDSREPKLPIRDFMYSENRFRMLTKSDPATAETLANLAQEGARERWRHYQHLAAEDFSSFADPVAAAPAGPAQEG